VKRLTLFSFGYYGWGNSTAQLVRLVDEVERSRGYAPPVFADCRIRRSVRAVGFNGAAFEKLLGSKRHRWMPQLGNQRIVSRSGPRIQIAEPAAANDLLDLALESAAEQRRVLFFCGCQFPKIDGAVHCHRATVGSLVLKFASRRGVPVELCEWPGGDPVPLDLDVDSHAFRSIEKGLMAIPLPVNIPLKRAGAIPWCSVATLHGEGRAVHRIVGPTVWRHAQWCLPVMHQLDDLRAALAVTKQKAAALRRAWGRE
jgi:hypothetical protein